MRTLSSIKKSARRNSLFLSAMLLLFSGSASFAQFSSTDGIIDFTNFTDLDSKEELIADHSGTPLNFVSPGSVNCALVSVLDREYDVIHIKGNPGACDIHLDLTALSGYTDPARIALLLDPERDGYTEFRPIFGTVSGSEVIWTGIQLGNLSNFRFGEAVMAYYSVSSGNVSGSIWSPVPGGSAGPAHNFCEYISLIISSGSNVSLQASSVTVDHLEIESGGTLDVSSVSGWKTVVVKGNWTNNGTFSTLQAVVQMDGDDLQYINGSTQEMSKLIVSNNQGVSIQCPELRLKRGVEFVDGGILYTNDALTLVSTSVRTAYIDDLSNGDVIGEITMERYHDASTGWFILSSPVHSATVADWNDDLVTTGFPGSDFPATSFVSIQAYDETIAGNRDIGYVPVSGVNEALVPGKGYFVYANAGAQMVKVSGEPVKGAHNLNVTHTPNGFGSADGWSLVANPYPSNVNWDHPDWVKQNVYNAIYQYDASIGGYATYVNGVGNNGGSPIIASSQGFFVRSQANPVLSVQETVKTKSTADFKSESLSLPVLHFEAKSLAGKDAFTLVIDPSAVKQFDAQNDALRMPILPGTLAVAALADEDQSFAIKRMPNEDNGLHIPVALSIPESGFVSFGAFFDEKHSAFTISLEDLRTGSNYILNDGHEAFIELDGGNHDGRFILHIENKSSITELAPERFVHAVADANGIWISSSHELEGNTAIRVYNSLGKLVAELNTLQPASREYLPLNGAKGQLIIHAILPQGMGLESTKLVW